MRRAVLTVALLLAAPAAFAAVSSADRSFLQHEAQGASYELAIAQLAQQKATRPDVKAYAQRIVSDHEQANAELSKLAQSKGVSLPTEMTSNDQTRLAGLQNLQGNDFDRSYVQESVRINAGDKRDFAKEAKTTHDPAIRAYVKQFTGMDAQHEQAAKQLAAAGAS